MHTITKWIIVQIYIQLINSNAKDNSKLTKERAGAKDLRVNWTENPSRSLK